MKDRHVLFLYLAFLTLIFLPNEDEFKIHELSTVLFSQPTQLFFYIIEWVSHLKRRLLHFPACLALSLLKLSKPFFSLVVLQRREAIGEDRGRSLMRIKKRGQRMSCHPWIWRASMCFPKQRDGLWAVVTSPWTLCFSERKRMTISFPFFLCSSFHISLIPL